MAGYNTHTIPLDGIDFGLGPCSPTQSGPNLYPEMRRLILAGALVSTENPLMRSNNAFASEPLSSRISASVLLSKAVTRMEVTLKLTTAILALAAGVYTYLGVRELLNGSPTTVFFAAVIYSVAVSVGIYAFWVFLMQFMPHVVDRTGRGLMFGCMLLGSLMIVAMSSWLNASALAGAAAIQQHLAITVQNYTH